jgi:hypothetical protein
MLCSGHFWQLLPRFVCIPTLNFVLIFRRNYCHISLLPLHLVLFFQESTSCSSFWNDSSHLPLICYSVQGAYFSLSQLIVLVVTTCSLLIYLPTSEMYNINLYNTCDVLWVVMQDPSKEDNTKLSWLQFFQEINRILGLWLAAVWLETIHIQWNSSLVFLHLVNSRI